MDDAVGGSVYNIIEVVGYSSNGWEEAVKNAVDTACERLTNLRIAEIVELDTKLSEGNVIAFRARVRLSFKHEIEPETL
jgi:flavin-binding protein dodecin